MFVAGTTLVLITNCGKTERDRESGTDDSGGSAGTASDSGGRPATGSGGKPSAGGHGGAENPGAGGKGEAGAQSLAGQGGQGGTDDPIEDGGEGGAPTGEGGVAGSEDDGIPACGAIGAPVADQANTENLGWYASANADYRVGQTFTVNLAGRLAGIQTSPSLFYGALASDTLTLDLYACSSIDSCSSVSLGSKTISAKDFPLYDPATLTAGVVGPGYFDLCSLELQVQPGEIYLFQLTGPPGPKCEDGLCAPDPTGTVWACDDDFECWARAFAISLNGFYQQPLKGYPNGRVFGNGSPEPTPDYNDLNFVTYVAP